MASGRLEFSSFLQIESDNQVILGVWRACPTRVRIFVEQAEFAAHEYF